MTMQTAEARRFERVNVDAEIGRRVHTRMWDMRVSQTALGETIGIGQSALGRRLRGERGWSAAELRAVGIALDVSVAALFGEEDMPSPAGPKGRASDYGGDVSDLDAYRRGRLASSVVEGHEATVGPRARRV